MRFRALTPIALGIGIMPFQLINFGQLFFIGLYRAFFRLTPRGKPNISIYICFPVLISSYQCDTSNSAEFTEVYTPPAINYGMVYPPAIMVFILTLTYSVISPLILIFGAIYFGVGCRSLLASETCASLQGC
jgi:hypothetical protein